MQKRKKSVAALLVFAILTIAIQAQVFGLEFSDVNITASYHKAVDVLSNHGIIQGRGDGVFAPKDSMTRAEFCAILARANGYSASYYQPKELPFTDIEPGFWAIPYISFCYENGYISGMLDGTFCPNDYVTDEQAIKMVVCSSGIGDETLSKVGPKWYSGYLNVAQKYDLLQDTTARVSNSSNRGFVAQIVYNATLRKADSSTVDKALESEKNAKLDDATSGEDSESVINSITKKAEEKQLSAQEKAKQEADNKARQEAEVKAKADAEAKATAKKEAKAKKEAEEKAKREAEEKARKEAEEKAKKEADAKAEKEAKAKREAEEKAEKEAKAKRNAKISAAKKDGKNIIVIDAGHNYSITDTGAVGNGLREQDITFYIAEKVKPLLEKNGFTVIMTREKLTDNVSELSVSASLKERAAIANEAGAVLFISIHCNAGGGTGTETYYCTGSDEGKALAQYIHEAVMEEVGLTDRGVKNATFSVLRNTDMPATLLETAFIDNSSDAKVLADKNYQKAYATGIAKGVCEFFGLNYKN